jgi:hypothetical protein
LILASVETFVTFKVSYRASVVLGAVLLQTSPRRGLPGGRTEAFLRAMREVRISSFTYPFIVQYIMDDGMFVD